jgi:hypothetical protein
MTPLPRQRRYLLATTAALVLALTACTGHPNPGASSTEDPLPVKHQTDAAQLLKSHADALAATIGAQLTGWETIAAPCEGANGEQATDGRWNLSGHANIPVPPDQQIATLNRIHDQWKRQGYQITEFRTFPPDNKGGTVTARNPSDGVSITLESTGPGTEFAVLMLTPCYRPAPGESPGT